MKTCDECGRSVRAPDYLGGPKLVCPECAEESREEVSADE